jgi:hypothetical protein
MKWIILTFATILGVGILAIFADDPLEGIYGLDSAWHPDH